MAIAVQVMQLIATLACSVHMSSNDVQPLLTSRTVGEIHRRQPWLLRSSTLWTRVVGNGRHVRRGSDVTEIVKRQTESAKRLSPRRLFWAISAMGEPRPWQPLRHRSVPGQRHNGARTGMGNAMVPSCERIRCFGPAYVTLHPCVFQKMLSPGPVYLIGMSAAPPTRRATSDDQTCNTDDLAI